jgi:hypothetical protein
LRANPPTHLLLLQLLSPCTDGPTLETRLDCVSELLASEHVFMGLAGTLPKLCDLDAGDTVTAISWAVKGVLLAIGTNTGKVRVIAPSPYLIPPI